jgi:hypothetical protein
MAYTLEELVAILENPEDPCCYLDPQIALQEIINQLTRLIIEAIEANVHLTNLDTKLPGLWIPDCDYISAAYPLATQVVYTYRNGGPGGVLVATLTVNYTDATHTDIADVHIVRV